MNSEYKKLSKPITRNQLTTPDRQVVNVTDVRNFRIFKKGALTMAAGTTTASVEHNLGYPPTYLAYGSPSSFTTPGYYLLPFFENDGVNNPRIIVNVTDTTLEFLRTFSSGTLRIFYYIFREKAV